MENAKTETQNTENNGNEIDYKAEYEKFKAEKDNLLAEIEKQKKLKDQYATENADYKKKQQAQMTDEQKKEQEFNDIVESNNQLKAEIAKMKLEKECLSNKFTAEETDVLVKANVSVEGVKEIAKIIQTRVDDAIKSAKAELTKSSTSKDVLGKGTTSTSEEKSDFQKHQEMKNAQNNIVKF